MRSRDKAFREENLSNMVILLRMRLLRRYGILVKMKRKLQKFVQYQGRYQLSMKYKSLVWKASSKVENLSD